MRVSMSLQNLCPQGNVKTTTEVCFRKVCHGRICEKIYETKTSFIFSFICKHFSVNVASVFKQQTSSFLYPQQKKSLTRTFFKTFCSTCGVFFSQTKSIQMCMYIVHQCAILSIPQCEDFRKSYLQRFLRMSSFT